jgi:VanZ like protein
VPRFLLSVAVACILVATLTPAGTVLEPDFTRCLVCGARGLSDSLVNVILFAPLGITLALNGRSGMRAVLLGGMLSCGVELAQIYIPGRDPSLGDVVANTVGTAAGQAIFGLAGRWLLPNTRSAARLSLLAAGLLLAVFIATARLLEPSLPAGTVRTWYTPALPDLEWYHGRVLRAKLGPIALRPGRSFESAAVRGLLLEEAPLRIDATAGEAVRGLAPLLVIEDEQGREIILAGLDREDLVFRYAPQASRWRLDQPDLRLRRAFAAVHPGDTVQIAIRRQGRGYCLALNRAARCDLGNSVGSGWALLYYPRHFPVWVYTLLEAGWVAGLAFPIGLWARRRPETALAVALLGVALFVPFSGLIRTPPHQLVGAAAGLVLGRSLQAWRRAVSARAG